MLRLPIRSRMLDSAAPMFSAPPACSVSLDNEAEVQICVHRDMEISERGMRFACCREFPLGTQLAVSMMHMHPRLGPCRMTLEGIVAGADDVYADERAEEVWKTLKCDPGAIYAPLQKRWDER